MSERPTPETDAAWQDRDTVYRVETSRKLERERDELRRVIGFMAQNAEFWEERAEEAREQLKEACKHLKDANRGAERNAIVSNIQAGKLVELRKERDQWENDFDGMKRERDEAREEADKWKKLHDTKDELFKKGIAEVERERDEARSLTEHQWLLKVGSRLAVAGCKSDGIIDSLDEIIRERDEAREICRNLLEVISYLAPDLPDREGHTAERAAVERCWKMLNDREATK